MTLFVALIAALAALAEPPPPGTPGRVHRLVVITGRSASLDDLSANELRNIYTARTTRRAGRRIIPVVLGSREPAEIYFLNNVVGMNEIDFTQWWIGAVFRGQVAAPPRLASSPAEACSFVAAHNNAIAFVEAADVCAEAKVINIDGRRFDEAGYAFQWTSK